MPVYTICLNTVKIAEKQQVACGIITEMNQVILFFFFSNSESFENKISITGNTYNVGDGEAVYDADKVGKNGTEIVVPLKHLSNICITLNIH